MEGQGQLLAFSIMYSGLSTAWLAMPLCMNTDYFRNMQFLQGLRSKEDLAYRRPLSIDETPEGTVGK